MLKDIVDTLRQIDSVHTELKSLADFIRRQDKKMDKLAAKERFMAHHNCYAIVRDMTAAICSGLDEWNALKEVCDKYTGVLRPDVVKTVWRTARKERFALTMYARVYMAHKMRENGFKICEIQNTMNLSKTSVLKLLKASLFDANNKSNFCG